jgi:hypothetical protein
MSVIRSQKNRENPFVQLDKRMFEDKNLSLKAKGFIGYCLSKPDHWKFHVSHLSTVLMEKKDAIYNSINECVEQGYCIKYQPRRKDGKMSIVEYIISDSKEEISRIKEELKEILPQTGNPEAVNPVAEDPQLVIMNSSHNDYEATTPKKENKKKEDKQSSSFPKEKIQDLEDFPIKPENRMKAYEEFSKEVILRSILYCKNRKTDDLDGYFLACLKNDCWGKNPEDENQKKKDLDDLIEYSEKNKSFVRKFIKENWTLIRNAKTNIYDSNNFVRISNEVSEYKIYFDVVNFNDQFSNALRKLDII